MIRTNRPTITPIAVGLWLTGVVAGPSLFAHAPDAASSAGGATPRPAASNPRNTSEPGRGDDESTSALPVAGQPRSTAQPATSPPHVVSSCSNLDARLLRKYIDIEVHGLLSTKILGNDLLFVLKCGDKIVLHLRDPRSAFSAGRSLDSMTNRPDRERVVALAFSQLLLASLPSILAARRKAAEAKSIASQKRNEARPAHRDHVSNETRPHDNLLSARTAVSRSRWAMGIASHLVLFDLGRPLALPGAEATASLRLAEVWDLTADFLIDGGTTRREAGKVSLLRTGLYLGIRWRWLELKNTTFLSQIRLGAAYLWMKGSSNATFIGRTQKAWSADASLSVGALWHVGATTGIAALFEMGYLYPGFVGWVPGEDDVRFTALWMGGKVAVDFGL